MKEEQFYNENEQKRVNKLVDDMTLFDDDLMSHVFDKNIEATELILRIILGEDIKVISVDGQDELKNPLVDGRNITLDVHAVDSHGKEMDIEVQSDAKGASVERARFHSSMMDARMLKASQDFKELKDSYVIFIYKKDKFNVIIKPNGNSKFTISLPVFLTIIFPGPASDSLSLPPTATAEELPARD